MNFAKNNKVTILILAATIILAGVATFTAVRLYQLRVQPISPASPNTSGAQGLPSNFADSQCSLTFTLNLATPGASGSPRATASGSPRATVSSSASPRATSTASASPNLGVGGLTTTATPSTTPRATASATPRATATTIAVATTTPGQLPAAGFALPTLIGIGAAILLLITALALAL